MADKANKSTVTHTCIAIFLTILLFIGFVVVRRKSKYDIATQWIADSKFVGTSLVAIEKQFGSAEVINEQHWNRAIFLGPTPGIGIGYAYLYLQTSADGVIVDATVIAD